MRYDLLLAVRTLLRNPGFTCVALLALALGIGVNTAIFSVVNAVLLRALPYNEANRLALVWSPNAELTARFGDALPPSNGDYTDWRKRNHVFSSMAAFRTAPLNLSQDGQTDRAAGVRVSAHFFDTLQGKPLIGRTFTEDDDQPGKKLVVVTETLWQNRFAADPHILGRDITLDNDHYKVIGVMPKTFRFPLSAEMPGGSAFAPATDLWIPMGWDLNEAQSRRSHNIVVIARLKPVVTLQNAQAEMTSIAQQLQVEHPNDSKGWGAKVQFMREQAVSGIRPALLLLMGAVSFVLLIACANVANLLLALATSRAKEVSLRAALGAGRTRIVRQLLTESVVLALVGATFGLAVAAVLIRSLLSLAPPSLPRIQETGLDLAALAFTTVVALVTGILFGLAPAFQISRVDLNSSLKQGGRMGSGGGHLIRDVLVVCEVAFTLVVLVGAGLLIRSFYSIEAVDPGFTTTSVLAMDFAMPAKRYPTNDQRAQICTRILDRLRVLPGVTAAGGITQLPLSGHESITSLAIEGRSQRPDEFTPVDDRVATPTYFEAIGIPLRRGRIFTESDKNPAVINETLARTYFPDQDPIGRRVSSNNSPLLTIVGVVGDVRHSGLETPARAQLYRSYFQNGPSQFTFVLRTSANVASLASVARREIPSIESDQAVTNVRTMEEIMAKAVEARRFNTVALSVFAGLAFLLTIVGLYGVISYSVSQRTAEIGIRMAVGAHRATVLGMVLAQGMKLTLIGTLVGLAGSFALTRFLASLLFGVNSLDPLTFSIAIVLLFAVAALASFVPAARASRVDPLVALRHE